MSKRAKRGFSLLEMLVALAILVFIVMGIGVGMDAGVKIYKEAIFEADSGSLSGIINTNLGDILRYSSRVTVNKGDNLQDASGVFVSKQDVEFVFTSMEYGIHDAYFCMPEEQEGTNDGVLQITNLKKEKTLELVNSGRVTREDALAISDNPEGLKMNFEGIFLSADAGGGLVG